MPEGGVDGCCCADAEMHPSSHANAFAPGVSFYFISRMLRSSEGASQCATRQPASPALPLDEPRRHPTMCRRQHQKFNRCLTGRSQVFVTQACSGCRTWRHDSKPALQLSGTLESCAFQPSKMHEAEFHHTREKASGLAWIQTHNS